MELSLAAEQTRQSEQFLTASLEQTQTTLVCSHRGRRLSSSKQTTLRTPHGNSCFGVETHRLATSRPKSDPPGPETRPFNLVEAKRKEQCFPSCTRESDGTMRRAQEAYRRGCRLGGRGEAICAAGKRRNVEITGEGPRQGRRV